MEILIHACNKFSVYNQYNVRYSYHFPLKKKFCHFYFTDRPLFNEIAKPEKSSLYGKLTAKVNASKTIWKPFFVTREKWSLSK